MKGIIVAAGMGTRARPFTEDLPKCLLEIDGSTLLERAVARFKEVGVEDITVIRGYRKEKIQHPEVSFLDNNHYATTNILHSFMVSRSKLLEAEQVGDTVIASYSDILFEASTVEALLHEGRGEVTVVVDEDWQTAYQGRTCHPISEAELAVYDPRGGLLQIGKNLDPEKLDGYRRRDARVGEFIGMWRLSSKGSRAFLEHFDRLDASLGPRDLFQNAAHWSKAYVTDFLQELVDRGVEVGCARIQGGWQEIDTVQDYQRACARSKRVSSLQ